MKVCQQRQSSPVTDANWRQYIPLRDFDVVTNALNFTTADLHVIGGCDVYSIKGKDVTKSIEKDVESSLEAESQHDSATSIRVPHLKANDFGKKGQSGVRKPRSRSAGRRDKKKELPVFRVPQRASPFGPLTQVSARRTFAYIIATLNATHRDYDFSLHLRPSDFQKEDGMRGIMTTVDSTLYNLQPGRHVFASNSFPTPSSSTLSASAIPVTAVKEYWSERMWRLIDKGMDLDKCEIYTYLPDEDPFDGEEPAIWKMHHFFVNKEMKRVCYLYLRGLSVISNSPPNFPLAHSRPELGWRNLSSVSVGEGAGKRASYWLGGSGLRNEVDTETYGDDDDDEMVIAGLSDVEGEEQVRDLDDVRESLARGGWLSYGTESVDDVYAEELDDAYRDEGWQPTDRIRNVSEEVGECMEI